MIDDLDLDNTLKRLPKSLPREAGFATEQQVLQAFRAAHRNTRRVWVYCLAAAACLVFTLAWTVQHRTRRSAQMPVASGINSYVTPPGFITLPYAQSDVPIEDAVIVRMQLQSSELRAMGLQAFRVRSNKRLNAELLIGQDGMARAVRVIE
jgi:hypothetical protein